MEFIPHLLFILSESGFAGFERIHRILKTWQRA
jgi:hypothetical protein